MWLANAFLSAILTGCVPILGAGASKAVGSERSALVRSGFVLLGAAILCLCKGTTLAILNWAGWLLFLFSGLFDAAAWLLFYRAIRGGDAEIAVIREKSCVPLSILLSCALSLTLPTPVQWASIAIFALGILYATRSSRQTLPFLSAGCSALQMQLTKAGIEQVGSQESALFLRSVFSLIFLLIFVRLFPSDGQTAVLSAKSQSRLRPTTVFCLIGSGVCAFFAWKFCFSALTEASPAVVQAITKLSFWIVALYYSIRGGGIQRKYWFGYAAMTVGSLVLIA